MKLARQLWISGNLLFLAFLAHPASAGARPPFHVLYSNDSTNLTACVSPWHKNGEPFREEMLKASIDEAVDAGVDAYFLQPGLTAVPLWKSSIYPPAEHFEWWSKTFRGKLHEFGDYMLGGGDLVAAFVTHCRSRGVAPFVSLRVNDYHLVELLDTPAGKRLPSFASLAVDRFRREQADLRINPTTKDARDTFEIRDRSVLDWSKPEVRERLLGFTGEICGYDIDGLELDFLRHFRLFPPGTTTREDRVKIVTEFVQNVRRLLDRSERKERHRWLCLRVPAAAQVRDELGLDLPSLVHAGAEMFNLSSNYYTVQQDIDWPRIRGEASDAAIYLEMTHVTEVGTDAGRGSGDADLYRRTTDEQFTTTAYSALAHGADGVSLFNFAYYREYGSKPERGPFHEPPFSVIRALGDRAMLARLPQHYFLAPVWRSPYGVPVQLPKRLRPGKPADVTLDLVPPEGGWQANGLLRIQSEKPFGPGEISATFNGNPLKPAGSVAEPYPTPYPQMLGTRETLRGFQVPASIVREGRNQIQFTAGRDMNATIVFVDLALPGTQPR